MITSQAFVCLRVLDLAVVRWVGLRCGVDNLSLPISAPRPFKPHTSTEAPAKRRKDSRPYTASWRECRSSSISPAAVMSASLFVRGFLARDREASESCAVFGLLDAADIKCVDAGGHKPVRLARNGLRGCVQEVVFMPDLNHDRNVHLPADLSLT